MKSDLNIEKCVATVKKLKITEEERRVDEAEPLSPAGMRDQGSEYLGTFQGCVDFCCLTLLERISHNSRAQRSQRQGDGFDSH